MLNRQQRRALERAAKKTHKLEPQVCVLWVPAARGYLDQINLDGFTVVDQAEHAQRFCEHYACSVALLLRQYFGARAVVRPYVAIAHRQIGRGSSVSPLPAMPS